MTDHSYFLIRLPVHEGFGPIEEKAQARDEVYDQTTEQVARLLSALQPKLAQGVIEMTQPGSPRSPTQKYRLTEFGKKVYEVVSLRRPAP